jgi:alcohol dehydrogenase (cytochrome c)
VTRRFQRRRRQPADSAIRTTLLALVAFARRGVEMLNDTEIGTTRRKPATLCLAVLIACSSLTAQSPSPDSTNWLTYSGNDAGWRYSALKQITVSNVTQLAPQWVFQIGDLGKFETTPLVVDGIMYGSGQNGRAFALDARTGKAIWRSARNLPKDIKACCGNVNRGLAIDGDRLFMATLDAHVVAMDTRTGNVLWDVKAADHAEGYSFTLAPLVVKGKVIVGVSGGEYPIRGFVDAYDTATGRRSWRFYTIPGPAEPGHESWSGDSWKIGGAGAWVTGSYDPELNLLYWPTGNPAPSNYGGQRKGDNRYSNSMLALVPDTGELKWYFQFSPHDVFDYDATQTPVLVDAVWNGQRRKLLLHANRNAFFYVLDRVTGQFLLAKPFVQQTWAKGMTPEGRPIPNPDAVPTADGTHVCPGWAGGVNWNPSSYSPQTGLLYVNAREESCTIYGGRAETPVPGRYYIGGTFGTPANQKDWGVIRAIDPLSGDIKWEFKLYSAGWGGLLSTAGDVAFVGDNEGNFIGLNARTGEDLWHFQMGSPVFAAPMTYMLDGKQYVVVASGSALFAFALAGGN